MVFSHTCSKTLFSKTPHGMTAQFKPGCVALIRNRSLPSHYMVLFDSENTLSTSLKEIQDMFFLQNTSIKNIKACVPAKHLTR